MFLVLMQSLIALGVWMTANKEPSLIDCILLGFGLFMLYWLMGVAFGGERESSREGIAKEPQFKPRPWLNAEQLPPSVIQDAVRWANNHTLTSEQKAYIQGRNNAIAEIRAKCAGTVAIEANAHGAVLSVFVQQPQESDHDMY